MFYFLTILLGVLLTLVIALAWYLKIQTRFSYFSSKGIIGPKPRYPYGNTRDGYKGKRNMVYDVDDIYRYDKIF